MYDMPAEIDVRADGALRIITLNRPDSLNSVNDDLHSGWPEYGSGSPTIPPLVPR